MIANNLFNLRSRKKTSIYSNVQNYNCQRKYDLAYMIDKYKTSAHNYEKWVRENINPSGDKKAIEFISLDKLFFTMNPNYMKLFRNIYVLDKQDGLVIQLKSSIKQALKTFITKNEKNKKLDLDNNSIDIICTSDVFSTYPAKVRFDFLSESLRVLKHNGIFYFKCHSDDYFNSIYQLLSEYDSTFASNLNIDNFSILNIDEVCEYFSSLFSDVDFEEFNGDWWITNVDDFIGYLLSEKSFDSLKPIISASGLSNFRKFLLKKVDEDGGILIKHRIHIITCKYKHELKHVS